MMIGIGLDNTNDLSLNLDGSISMVEDANKIAQDLKTRLSILKGEAFLDRKYGIEYGMLTDGRYIALSDFELLIKKYILETFGVTKLNSFFLENGSANERKMKVSFSVSTVYETGILNLPSVTIGV